MRIQLKFIWIKWWHTSKKRSERESQMMTTTMLTTVLEWFNRMIISCSSSSSSLRYNSSTVHIYMHGLQANRDTLHYFNTLALLSRVRLPIDVDSCVPIGTSEHNWLTTSRNIFFTNRTDDIILATKSVIPVELRRLGEFSSSPLSLLSIDRRNNKLFSFFFAVLDFDFFIIKLLSCQNER